VNKDAKKEPPSPAAVPSVEAVGPVPVGLCLKGRYRIVSELGGGGFGVACLAEDEATGQRVAIRLLPRALAGVARAEAKQRIARSIVAASAHPALVRVLEFGEAENGQAFVAMELVEGRRLKDTLSKGPLDVAAALRMALELGGGIEVLHKLGLAHGALRPCNVMVLEDGRVKLMDVELIGLRDVKVMKSAGAAEPPAEYLSPEQIRRVPVTEKTDIYSFGVLLYEMLCGVPPFQGETREAILAKHLTGTPIPMRRQRRTVPVSVESAVALALYKQPDLRPPMHNVVNRLWAEAHAPGNRWKRTAAIVGGAAVAASIAALAGWGQLIARAPEPPAPSAAPAAKQAREGAPPTSGGPSTETPAPLSAGTASPASGRMEAARATPRALPPAAASPKTEPQDHSRTRQASANAARKQPASAGDEDAYDPGAVIDWLIRSSPRGQ
jgi:serine/threonine protein kinase